MPKTFNKTELKKICLAALRTARKQLRAIGASGQTEVKTKRDEISTAGDFSVSAELIRFFRRSGIPAVLYSEESGRIALSKKPRFTISFDDIDGTDNYHRGRGFLPHCNL